MSIQKNTLGRAVVLVTIPILALTACGGADGGNGEAEDTVLTLAHSYNDGQPQVECGINVLEEEVNSSDVGFTIETFGSSQLGGDADRIASVASGDIDIDIQGASALGAIYEPVSVMDAAYAFDDAEHLARFMDGSESDSVMEDFQAETGIHTLGAWSAGARHFTSGSSIQSPDDLDGLRIRFPGSPQYLMNARALGANATEVAFEEIYLSLQQGAVDGQENPTNIIDAENLAEVQDYINLTGHQLNTNLIIIGSVWEELEDEQRTALTTAVDNAVAEVTACVADDEEFKLDEWRETGQIEVVDDVDVDAFQDQAREYFEENLDEESLSVFESIRESTD